MQRVGECETAIPAGPSVAIPVIVGTVQQFDAVELMRTLLQHDRLESIGDMGCEQLAVQRRQRSRNSRCFEKAPTDRPIAVDAIAVA